MNLKTNMDSCLLQIGRNKILMKNKFKIKIVSVGDFGNSIIKNFSNFNLQNVEFFDLNTDWANIYESTNNYIKIGTKTTHGLGCGGHLSFGEKSAEEDKEKITNILEKSDFLIIVAGFGGGIGSGASPVVAKIAKKLNIPTIAFISVPANFEGKIRCENAKQGLKNIHCHTDKLIVFYLEKYITDKANLLTLPIDVSYKDMGEIIQKSILKVIDKIIIEVQNKKTIKKILELVKYDLPFIEVFEGN